MRALFLTFLTIALLFSLVQFGNAQEYQQFSALPVSALPQAQPVYNLLKACENSNFNLYQSVWAIETLKMYRYGDPKKNWTSIQKEYIKFFHGKIGNYRLQDLRYSFSKIDQSDTGVVSIIYRGKERTGFNVIQENGKWKIREL